MVLDTGEDNREQDGDTHGHCAECPEPRELAEGTGEREEEAYDGRDGAERHGTGGRVGERVEQLRTNETVEGCVRDMRTCTLRARGWKGDATETRLGERMGHGT